MQHSPAIVLAAWAALIAAGCTWVAPMLTVLLISVVVACWEYLR